MMSRRQSCPTPKPRPRAGLWGILLCLAASLLPWPTQAATQTVTEARSTQQSKELFEQGQRAFRRGELALAIDLYVQADNAGFSDPILFYNLGVAYYRLGQYDQARAAFVTAGATPELAPVAFYNLGLVAHKNGADREAYVWFDQAHRHPNASVRMQDLAQRAMAATDVPRTREIPLVFTQPERVRLTDHLLISLNTGFATDSNIYRSPSNPYVDLSQPGAPTVEPEVQSGTYIPVQAATALRWGTHEDSHFELKYALHGRIYSDSQFSNANVLEHELSVGGQVSRPTRRGGVYWRSHFLITRSNEQAYDRDDGQAELVNDVNVSDRYSSTRFGPDAYYHRDIGRFGYGFRFNAYIDRYDETLDYLDLTHEQYLGGAHISFKPLRNTLVRVSGDYYRRMYAERVATDIFGSRFTDNDELEYAYKNVGLSLRQRVSQGLIIGLDYRYTVRDDEFQGYDDYERHTGRGYVGFRRGRFNARASYTYRTYNFPNALNFDDTPADPWPLQSTHAELEAEYQLRRRFTLRAQALFNVVDSTDPRGEYNRNQLSVGIVWHP